VKALSVNIKFGLSRRWKLGGTPGEIILTRICKFRTHTCRKTMKKLTHIEEI